MAGRVVSITSVRQKPDQKQEQKQKPKQDQKQNIPTVRTNKYETIAAYASLPAVYKPARVTEYQECMKFIQWCKLRPSIYDNLIKHANEGNRTQREGYFLQAIGLKAGVPDYQLVIPNNKYHSLWIEMKATDARNKPKRESQNIWITRLNQQGHYATYCYGAAEAIITVLDYLSDKL